MQRLRNCSRSKETKKLLQLNTMCGSGLDPGPEKRVLVGQMMKFGKGLWIS